jgi:type IV secretory pathway VirB4 component
MDLGPGGIEQNPDHVVVDGVCCATLTVRCYPAAVLPGWLEAVSTYPALVDVSIHVEPVDQLQAASRLRKQRARLESTRRHDFGRGRLEDPLIEAAAEDAADLAHRVARAEARLFRAAIHLTTYAETHSELATILADLKALLASQLAATVPATFRHEAGRRASLPLALDRLGPSRTLDTLSLAASLPIASPDLPVNPRNPGVLWGLNTATGNPVFFDRWSQQNHNSVIFGSSGGGKSYLAKLDVARELMRGTAAVVIDPEGEYTALAEALGGVCAEPGQEPPDVPLTVYSLDGLPERDRAMALMRILEAVWRLAEPGDRRRMLVIDEAWRSMKDPAAAGFLYLIAKSARKHALALSLITQDTEDLTGTDLGRSVLANSATHLLLRQAPNSINQVAAAFGLSAGEAALVTSMPRGDVLLHAADGRRAAFTAIADPGMAYLHTGLVEAS